MSESWERKTHSIYQVSVIEALMQGVMEGVISIRELLGHGDFGIGTFEGLGGELIVLGGKAYNCKDDGTAEEAAPEAPVSFAQVTYFDRYAPLHRIEGISDAAELERKLSAWTLEDPNIIYAVKGHVEGASVSIRSIGHQKKPYPGLSEAAASQKVYHYENEAGTVIGFLFPKFMPHVNAPFWHFHFLSDACDKGGHLLEIRAEAMNLQVYPIFEHTIRLPEGKSFSRMRLSDEKSMEKALKDWSEPQKLDNVIF